MTFSFRGGDNLDHAHCEFAAQYRIVKSRVGNNAIPVFMAMIDRSSGALDLTFASRRRDDSEP